MIENDSSKETKKDGEQGDEHASDIRTDPLAAKEEIQSPEPVVPPAVPPIQFNTDTGAKSDETKKDCPKDISVKLIKETALSGFERRSLILSWVTLIVLIITFFVFALQLEESKTQTEIFRKQAEQAAQDATATHAQTEQQIGIAKDQFRLDQRPIIWLSNAQDQNLLFQLRQAVPPNGPRQILTTLHFSNYGKSPAYNMRVSRIMLVGERSDERIRPQPIEDRNGVLVPNGKDDFLTVVSAPLKDADIPNIGKDNWVSVFLRFKYEDSSGSSYESDICLSHLQNGPFRECDGNDIKDCAKVRCEK